MTDSNGLPLAPATPGCSDVRCRQLRGARIAQFSEVNTAWEQHQQDERALRHAELARFSRMSLDPAELLQEVERLETEVGVLSTYEDGPYRDSALAWYEPQLDEARVRLSRLVRSRATHTQSQIFDWDRVRLVDLVGMAESLTGTPATRQGANFRMTCPFHEGDRDPSLVIYSPGLGWHCFGCGRGGQDAVSFAAEFFHCSQGEGLRWVEQLCDLPES